MAASGDIIGLATGAFELIDRVQLYLDRYVARRDRAADNVELLKRLQEEYKTALQLVEEIEQQNTRDPEALCNEIVRSRLRMLKSHLQADNEQLDSLRKEVSSAGAMSRVRRDNEILENCRRDVADFYSFVSETVLPSLKENASSDPIAPETYAPSSNVPPNPPRLTLTYDAADTCEGRLKASILDGSRSGIVSVVASGLGGVGKTCALRGLAKDPEIIKLFPGGVLYIQLGNDAHLSDIVAGIADAVEATGGEQLARRINGVRTVLGASKKAVRWFRPHKCLFLVDDIWWVNGITSGVFGELGNLLHNESLLVYTTRDKRFMRGADKEVIFEHREARGGIAQRMLMTHGGLDSDNELNQEQRKALEGILDLCNGLPLAIGIAGATVKEYRDRRQTEKEDAWVDYYHNLRSREENIIGGSADRYGELRLIVDSSLEVLRANTGFKKPFDEMFRGFCILRKQQKVSGHVLQKLWSLDELREAREVARAFDEVSLVQMTGSWNEFYVQLHDLVLEIAMQKASNRYEVKSWFGSLLNNYMSKERIANGEGVSSLESVAQDRDTLRRKVPRGLRLVTSCARKCFCSEGDDAQTETEKTDNAVVTENTDGEAVLRPWWTVEDDGYLHDNLCRALRGAGEKRELIWLLERAQWIVPRLQKSGISGIEEDVRAGMQVLDKKETEETEMRSYLTLVGSAARMSWFRIVENAYEAWFQMYGRTVWSAEQCVRTRKFVSEIQEHAPRPFVRPSVGFLDEAGGPRSERIRIETCKYNICVWNGEDMIRILWTGWDGKAFVTEYNKTYGTRKAHMLSSVGVDKDSSGDAERHSASSDTRSMVEECIGGAFSDNQKRLVTLYRSGNLIVWDVDRGYKVYAYREYGSRVDCVAISGDGKIVAYGLSGSQWIWDTSLQDDTENPFEALEMQREVNAVSMSYDGKRVVTLYRKERLYVGGDIHSWDRDVGGDIHLWDRDVGRAMTVPPEMQTGDMSSTTISGDGKRVVSGSWDGTIRIWNVGSTAGAVRSMRGHRKRVRHVALNADGTRIVSALDDYTACVWDAETGVMIGQPLEVGDNACVSISPDGKQVATWSNIADTVQLFDAEKMSASLRPERFTGRVRCVAYDGHGTRVVSGSYDGRVRVWDRTNGQLIAEAQERHAGAVECVAVSADGGRIVSGGWDRSVRVWGANCDAVAPPLEKVGGKQLGWIHSVAVNNDGTRVLFCSRTGVFMWDVRSGDVTAITPGEEPYGAVAMSCDGARVAFASGEYRRTVTVWDVHARRTVASSLTGHTNGVESVVFSGDGTRVLSGSSDRTVRVWDVDSGKAIGHPLAHERRVFNVQSNVDGSLVVSYDERGYGRMWHVGRGECVITSADAEWLSTLHRHRLALFSSFGFRIAFGTRIMRHFGSEKDKLLASTDTPVVLVGNHYFSRGHGAKFWPFATIVT